MANSTWFLESERLALLVEYKKAKNCLLSELRKKLRDIKTLAGSTGQESFINVRNPYSNNPSIPYRKKCQQFWKGYSRTKVVENHRDVKNNKTACALIRRIRRSLGKDKPKRPGKKRKKKKFENVKNYNHLHNLMDKLRKKMNEEGLDEVTSRQVKKYFNSKKLDSKWQEGEDEKKIKQNIVRGFVKNKKPKVVEEKLVKADVEDEKIYFEDLMQSFNNNHVSSKSEKIEEKPLSFCEKLVLVRDSGLSEHEKIAFIELNKNQGTVNQERFFSPIVRASPNDKEQVLVPKGCAHIFPTGSLDLSKGETEMSKLTDYGNVMLKTVKPIKKNPVYHSLNIESDRLPPIEYLSPTFEGEVDPPLVERDRKEKFWLKQNDSKKPGLLRPVLSEKPPEPIGPSVKVFDMESLMRQKRGMVSRESVYTVLKSDHEKILDSIVARQIESDAMDGKYCSACESRYDNCECGMRGSAVKKKDRVPFGEKEYDVDTPARGSRI